MVTSTFCPAAGLVEGAERQRAQVDHLTRLIEGFIGGEQQPIVAFEFDGLLKAIGAQREVVSTIKV